MQLRRQELLRDRGLFNEHKSKGSYGITHTRPYTSFTPKDTVTVDVELSPGMAILSVDSEFGAIYMSYLEPVNAMATQKTTILFAREGTTIPDTAWNSGNYIGSIFVSQENARVTRFHVWRLR